MRLAWLLGLILVGCGGPKAKPPVLDAELDVCQPVTSPIWSQCTGYASRRLCGVGLAIVTLDAGVIRADGGCNCESLETFLDGGRRLLFYEGAEGPGQKAVLWDAGQLAGTCHNGGNAPRCGDPKGNPDGCGQYYADPVGCAKQGFVNGYLVSESLTGTGPENVHDGDNHATVCPLSQGAQRVGATGVIPLELRDFTDCGLGLETEHPWCRWFGGPIAIEADDAGHPEAPFPEFRAQLGERVSMVGDWIAEPSQTGTELHETRIHVTVRQEPSMADVYHLLTSAQFAADSGQSDFLFIEVPIPASSNPAVLSKLICNPTPATATAGCNELDPLGLNVEVSPDGGSCLIAINRLNRPITSEFDCGHQDGTTCLCQTPNCAPTNFDRCHPGFANESTIAFAGDFRAWWADPLDTWECACACDDPALPGTSIVAPVHGCVPSATFADDEDDSRAAACAVACGGTMCGAAPACRIGQCRPVVGPLPFARTVGAGVCEPPPPMPDPPARVASASDYRVQLGPTSRLRVGKFVLGAFVEGGRSQVSGNVWLSQRVDAGTAALEFASIEIGAQDFTAGFLTDTIAVHAARAYSLNRFPATQLLGPTFEIPIGAVRFAVQAWADGVFGGTALQNEGPAVVTFDLPNDGFAMQANGQDSKGNVVFIELAGTIVNHPPLANPGPDRALECQSSTTTPVPLDAAASTDPDLGDSISHYQWFEGETGLSNQSAAVVPASLGTHDYTLRVYDKKLGSSAATQRVTVVDSVGPQLVVQPSPACLWPPNHEYALFRLGQELSVSVNDTCDPNPTVWIDSVTADEPTSSIGSGNTAPDVVSGAQTACVRAERQGGQNGREYTVVVKARDASCNETTKQVKVIVPHDQSGHPGCQQAQGVDVPDATCAQGASPAVCSRASR